MIKCSVRHRGYEILGYGSSGTDQVLINRCCSKIAYVWHSSAVKNDDVGGC